MNDLPRQTLINLIASHGVVLCAEPRRLEGLLRDLCWERRREVNLLMSALKGGVAADLQNSSEPGAPVVLLARLSKRLEDDLGLQETAARWAVESWALALGIGSVGSNPSQPISSDPLDLVLAIELGGDEEHVRQRLDLARRTIERCQSGFSNPASLRVGLLGYIDHQFGRLRPLGPGDDPVRFFPLQGAAAVVVDLSAWEPSGSVEDDLGAPIEDALTALKNFSWRRSRHVLLTFGSRPPHPATQEADLGRPCPHGLHWRHLLRNAKRGFGLRCIAVVGPPSWKGGPPTDRSWVDRNRDAWLALGEGGRYEFGDADPEQLATAAGVAGKDTGPLLLPLAL